MAQLRLLRLKVREGDLLGTLKRRPAIVTGAGVFVESQIYVLQILRLRAKVGGKPHAVWEDIPIVDEEDSDGARSEA